MKRMLCWLMFSFALSVLFVSASSATIVDIVWTGKTLFGGNDGLGLFGPVGPVPADTPYTAEYRFDTTIGYSENVVTGTQSVTGGTFFDPDLPIPLIDASITINGVTFPANGDYYSEFVRQTGQGFSIVSALAQRLITGNPVPFGGELFQRVQRPGNYYSLPLDAPGEFDLDASDSPGGEFLFLNRDAIGNISGPTTQIQLMPSHVSIRPVPEPGSSFLLTVAWVLGIGGSLRRMNHSQRTNHYE